MRIWANNHTRRNTFLFRTYPQCQVWTGHCLSKSTPLEVCSSRKNETTEKREKACFLMANSNLCNMARPQVIYANRHFYQDLLDSPGDFFSLGFKIIYINTLGRCDQLHVTICFSRCVKALSLFKHFKTKWRTKDIKNQVLIGKMANLRK